MGKKRKFACDKGDYERDAAFKWRHLGNKRGNNGPLEHTVKGTPLVQGNSSTCDFLEITSSDMEGSKKKVDHKQTHIPADEDEVPPELVSSNAKRLKIINLSDYTLSPEEETVLQKGLTFSPMEKLDKFTVVKDLYFFCRKLTFKKFIQKTLHWKELRTVTDKSFKTSWNYYRKMRDPEQQVSPYLNEYLKSFSH